LLPYTTFDDIIKTLRSAIINYVGLDNNRVLNATSVRGPDLLKIINETELNSFNLNDSFIVFELKESNDKDYYIMSENDDENSIIARYQMDIKLYGSPCHIISQKMLSVFKEELVLEELYNKGVHFTGITFPESNNEFINNTLWKRCDMTIHLEARMKVDKFFKDKYFDDNMSKDEILKKIIIKSNIIK